MRFQDITYSFLFLAIPILIIILLVGVKRKQKLLENFADKVRWEHLVPTISYTRRFWKKVLVIMALAFSVLVIMRPQYGTKYESLSRKGQDILIVLDTSASMLAQDVSPSRFELAKKETQGLIENLKGDRVGIMAFSGISRVQCPLTLDYSAVKLFLEDIQVGAVQKPGTNIEEAIKVAINVFKHKEKKYKIMIVFSDGESLLGDPVKIAKQAARAGIKIYTVGIGTKSGEPIPIKDEKGVVVEYKKDKNNEIVLSKLNEAVLQEIANVTGAIYYFADGSQLVVETLYKEIFSQEKRLMEQRRFAKYIDRYQWFLFVVFVLLIVDFLLPERKKKENVWKGRIA